MRDNIADIGDIAISLDYIVGLSTFYLQKYFQVNISIQYKVMDQKRFCRLIAVSRPSLIKSRPKLNQFFPFYEESFL